MKECGKNCEKFWTRCAEHSLSLIEPKSKGVSHFERDMQKEGKSWKNKLRQLFNEIISYSKNFKDFLKNCTDSGIEYVFTPCNKVKLKFRLKDEGQQRFTKADTIGENYTPERIAEQIAEIQKTLSAAHTVVESKAPEKTATQSNSAYAVCND